VDKRQGREDDRSEYNAAMVYLCLNVFVSVLAQHTDVVA
jgi:hypothetical protein